MKRKSLYDVIPHNHELDGHLHKGCPSCAYTQIRIKRVKEHKQADEGLKAIYERAIKKHLKRRGQQ